MDTRTNNKTSYRGAIKYLVALAVGVALAVCALVHWSAPIGFVQVFAALVMYAAFVPFITWAVSETIKDFRNR